MNETNWQLKYKITNQLVDRKFKEQWWSRGSDKYNVGVVNDGIPGDALWDNFIKEEIRGRVDNLTELNAILL